MKKLFWLVFSCIVFLFILPDFVCGQSLDSIPGMFKRYQENGVHEKLFVHTDKANYLAGETLWFKVYSTDASLNQPLDLSKVAYVEVLDSTNNTIVQAKIQLCNSSGNGAFKLPATLISGTYTVRAYTAWMKNFSAEYYFHQSFSILNSFQPSSKSSGIEPPKYDFQFFPEGGELVDGLQSEIAFKLTDYLGNGIDLTGIVLNERNDTVARFKSFKFGMGHFTFTPKITSKYRGIVFINGRSINAVFPLVKDKGYVMQLAQKGDSQYILQLRSNLPNSVNTKAYILIHTGQLLKIAQSVVLIDGKANFVFDKNKIGEGLSHITVFDGNGQAVAERLCFVQPKKLNINVTSQKQVYGLRQQVKLDIEVNNDKGLAEAADLSMSIFRKDGYSDWFTGNITSYLWLSSELKGKIEFPEYYFEGEYKAEALNNLLMTQGWRRFNWTEVISGKRQPIVFLPEYEGLIINAAVTDKKTGSAIAGAEAFIGQTGKQVQVVHSVSDYAGNFIFDMGKPEDKHELVLKLEHGKDSTCNVKLIPGYSDKYAPISKTANTIKSINSSLETGSVSMQVQTLFNTEAPPLPKIDSMPSFGKGKTYMLDQYTRFTTMEEVLREYVTEVNLNSRQKQWHITMINGTKILDGNPLLILDGIPVLETNDVINLDPLKIKKLEVIPNNYYIGQVTYAGILSFTSYNNDRKTIAVDPKAIVLDYEGLQSHRRFYMPDYSLENEKSNRIPDFRTVLCWMPSLLTNKNAKKEVQFYTSDNPGDYYGVIQGISAKGETGTKVFSITVKPEQ